MLAGAKAGVTLNVATPAGYQPNPEMVRLARADGRETGFSLNLTEDPRQAVAGADAVYTDVWASMGQESEKEDRARIFAPFQVNPGLMAEAKKGVYFMHCLPAHRGDEVTDEVIDSPASIVFDQAENRLHVQKGIMVLLMGKTEKNG
jgi:ornithine carbamoyltransferase